MKKILKVITAAALSALMVAAPVSAVMAAQTSETVAAGFTVLNVTAAELSENSGAIHQALETAGQLATDTNRYKVVVEPGEYMIYSSLKIYSNTTLSLDGVTLRRSRNNINFLRTGNDESVNSGVTGYYFRNITIDSGTFEGDGLGGTMLKIAHAKNFVMRNVRLQNAKNAHMMEVAGVDGFTAKSCGFINQLLDKGQDGLEAIQFDVLKKGNMTDCRSEDLSVRNALVESCLFDNCPRAVGSHTSIHNNPHTNMVIRNNIFRNLGSCGVQTQGWKNSVITGNKFDNMPRAIAVYTVKDNATGTYLPSTLATEGNTTQHYDDRYQAQNWGVTISGNNIYNCGNVDDIYSSYSKAAITVLGAVLTANGYNGIPAGDYTYDNVTVKNNLINVRGNGIRVEHAKNVSVDANVIYCHPVTTSENYYGIVFRSGVTNANITKNYIHKALVNGIQIDGSCALNNVSWNEIYITGKYGIAFYNSSVTNVSNNEVRDVATEGIFLHDSSIADRITENRIARAGEVGIHITSSAGAKMIDKNLISGCPESIGYTQSTGRVKVGSNYFSASALSSFKPDAANVTLKVGEYWRISRAPSPVNALVDYKYAVSDPNVIQADGTGRISALKPGTAKVTVTSTNGKTATVSVTVVENQPATVIGDLNGDKMVTADDYALLAGHTANWAGYETVSPNADVNEDGVINAKDRILLARYLDRQSGFDKLPNKMQATADGTAKLSVSDAQAQPGETFTVDVKLDKNPGMATADLSVLFDESALTLVSAEDKHLLSDAAEEHSDKKSMPYRLSWMNDLAAADTNAAGTLMTLTFQVDENAKAGDYSIAIAADSAELYDHEVKTVRCELTNGTVTVSAPEPSRLPGDVDGNGVVDVTDATLVQLHAALMITLEGDDLAAADVNGDGVTDVTDATLIQMTATQ